MYLTCSCCGSGFQDTIENTRRNDCDTGFGMCTDCDAWVAERNLQYNKNLIQQFADALNETNRKKYLEMDYEVQMGLILNALDDGVVKFEIGG